jgi:N-acetylmuramoyl-L-alanine amidase
MIPKSGNRFSDKIMRKHEEPTFAPDSPPAARVMASPNHDARNAAIDMIVLHYTGMQTAEAARARLCDANAQVSSHYFVDEDGRIDQFVPEERRAWHAGVSSWEGSSDVNARSIGIEIVNPGHAFGYRDFPAAQVGALIALTRDIVARRAIRADRVLAHSDVAPGRKQDPGEKFPWARLAAAGVGLWVEPAPLKPGIVVAPGDRNEQVARLQIQLAGYGYGIEVTEVYDEQTAIIVSAFQRHFRPARIDGIADLSTVDTLARLSAARATLA